MNERCTFAFRASILLVLLSAYSVFAAGSGDGRDLGLIAVMFIAAIYWRDWRFKRFDLRADLAQERIKRERPLFFVFGNVVESQAPEKSEKDTLLDTDLREYRMHSLTAYWLLVGVIGFMIKQRTNMFPFSLSLILTFLMISPLASASHLSHFLIPLGLSVLGVVVTSFRADEFAFGPLAIFTFSVFSALCFYQLLKVTYFERDVDRRDHFFATLKRASLAAVGFIIIVAVISKVFPKSEPIPQLTVAPIKKGQPSRVAREMARKIVDLDEFVRNRKPSQSSDASDTKAAQSGESAEQRQPSGGGESRASKDSLAGQPKVSDLPHVNLKGGKDGELPSDKRSSFGPEQEAKGGYGPQDLERKSAPGTHGPGEAVAQTKDAPSSERSMSPLPASSPGGLPQQAQADEKQLEDLRKRLSEESHKGAAQRSASTDQDLSKLGDKLNLPKGSSTDPRQANTHNDQGHDPKALEKLLEQERQRSQHADTRPQDSQVSNGKNGDGVRLGKQSGGARGDARDATNQMGDAGIQKASADTGSEAPKLTGSSNGKEAEKNKKVEALEKKIETVMTTFEKHSRFIMTVIIACVLIVLFSKYLASLKPKARSLTLSQREKQALADQLRELQNLKLSPQQEVIETYNVVMEILDRVELGREEGIPARIHMESLSRRLPRLGEPFINATDCFDHALYGEIEPDSKKLVEFRQSAKKIFRQFDIAA